MGLLFASIFPVIHAENEHEDTPVIDVSKLPEELYPTETPSENNYVYAGSLKKITGTNRAGTFKINYLKIPKKYLKPYSTIKYFYAYTNIKYNDWVFMGSSTRWRCEGGYFIIWRWKGTWVPVGYVYLKEMDVFFVPPNMWWHTYDKWTKVYWRIKGTGRWGYLTINKPGFYIITHYSKWQHINPWSGDIFGKQEYCVWQSKIFYVGKKGVSLSFDSEDMNILVPVGLLAIVGAVWYFGRKK